MNKQLPVTLVVGAGPVGMAGALELDRQGMRVRIIEKNEQRSTLSKAVGINARTLELLQPGGISQKLIARGLKVYRVNLRYGDRVLTTVDFSKMNHPFNFMLSLPQDETEAVLEQALQARDITVEKGVEFSGYETDGDTVLARIRRKDVASAFDVDYILGADGAHSAVRKSMGLDFPGRPYDDTWSLADVHMAWPYGHGEAHLIMRDDGKVLFAMSMPGKRYRLISNQGRVFDLLPERSEIRDVIWNTDFKVSLRQVVAYQKGPVFLAGDAAHIHSPAGGRGMNLGIEDAVVFARRLVAGKLETYSDQRFAVGHQVVRESDMQFRMSSVSNPLGRIFRNFMVRNVLGSERVQRKFRRRMAGIDHLAA